MEKEKKNLFIKSNFSQRKLTPVLVKGHVYFLFSKKRL